jgi:hypothetical protein
MTDSIKLYDKIVLDTKNGITNTSNACSRCSKGEQYQMPQTNPTAATAAQQKCGLCTTIKSYIIANKDNLEAHVADIVSIDKPESAIQTREREIKSELVRMNKIQSSIAYKKTTIEALKKRIELKHSILAAYPTKIKATMADLNSNIAQTKLNSKDKVDIGVPFLPTFFNVTKTKYVITFTALSLLAMALILAMIFSDLLGNRMIGK